MQQSSAAQWWSSLRDSTALGNRLTGLPNNKEGFSGGDFCLYFPTNPAMISNVWCLEIYAGTLFLMLLKFGAVLSIICGFLMAVLYLDPYTAVYCCRAVISEGAKTTLASGLQTLSLEREFNTFSRCVRPWIKFTQWQRDGQTQWALHSISSKPSKAYILGIEASIACIVSIPSKASMSANLPASNVWDRNHLFIFSVEDI